MKPNRPSYLRASVRLITTVRKVVVIAENTMSNSKAVLKILSPALTHQMTTSLMHRSCNDGVSQLSPLSFDVVLEVVVEISHACFVHLLLQCSPHTLVNWIYIRRIWRPQ